MNKEQITYILEKFNKYLVEEMRCESVYYEIEDFVENFDLESVDSILSEEDLSYIKSYIVSVCSVNNINIKDLSNEDIQSIYNEIPQYIKDDIIHWGVDDSVVRDNIYTYFNDNLNLLEKWKK